jgi:hypothetical protein
MERRTSRARLWRVYLAPTLIGLLSFCGLLAGLLSDGLARYFAWLSVGSPLFVCLWFYLQRVRGAK